MAYIKYDNFRGKYTPRHTAFMLQVDSDCIEWKISTPCMIIWMIQVLHTQCSMLHNGRVKLAGNIPFSPVASLIPINQPSSWNRNNSLKWDRLMIFTSKYVTEYIKAEKNSYLFFWIIILHNSDDFSNFKGQLIDILSRVFVCSFDPVENTWRKIVRCGSC